VVAVGGFAVLVVVGLIVAIVINTRQKHDDELLAQANKKAEALIAEGEAAFGNGNLDEAEKRAAEAIAIVLSTNGPKAENLTKKVVEKRESLRTAAEKASRDAEEKEKLETSRREREKIRIEEEAVARKEARRKEKEEEELNKLTEKQKLAWITCESLLSEMRQQVSEELKRMDLEVKIANKETDEDRKRLAKIRLQDEYKMKFHEMLVPYTRGLSNATRLLGKLPPDFESRYNTAVEEQTKEVLLAISNAFRGIN